MNELCHHGIKGQKWGKRNGPPYPLNEEGLASFRKNNLGEGKKKGSGSSNDYGSVPIAAVSVAAVTLASISPAIINSGSKKVHEMRVQGKFNKTIKELQKEKRKEQIDPETGLHLKSKEIDEIEDMRYVNPGKNKEIPATNLNCVACGITYEMRRRGYDVNAQATKEYMSAFDKIEKGFPESKVTTNDPWNIYGKPPIKDYKPNIPENTRAQYEKVDKAFVAARKGLNTKLADSYMTSLSKDKNSRGVMLVNFANGGGHCISYSVNNNGIITLLDSQSNVSYKDTGARWYLQHCAIASSIRLDNSSFNINEIKGAMYA